MAAGSVNFAGVTDRTIHRSTNFAHTVISTDECKYVFNRFNRFVCVGRFNAMRLFCCMCWRAEVADI